MNTTLDTFKITERKQMVIEIKKDKGLTNVKAQVVLIVDRSGSMDKLYKDGTVQDTVERILPLGLAFDDNGEVDAYAFHDGVKKMSETIRLKNLAGYVQNHIMKVSTGGTNYAPAINAIVEDFTSSSGGGFFGLGKKKANTLDLPVYVIFITDGENYDKSESEQALIEASNHGIFFQFVGVGRENFNFLRKLDDLKGRLVDNANFFKIEDLNKIGDTELYNKLMNEFPEWVKAAKQKNLIK